MTFALLMWWTSGTGTVPLTIGPFETEKLCVDAAALLWKEYKGRISGDFKCIQLSYPQEEK